MSTAETITYAIVGFFVLLSILVFLRLLLRKGPPHWNQIRLGVYIERVPADDWVILPEDESEQTTLVLPPKPTERKL